MKIACLLADGFEDVEALASAALLRRAGYIVDFFSVDHQSKVIGSYQTVVTDIIDINQLHIDDYDALFIPGGKAAFRLREDTRIKEIALSFNQQEKWMLSICAAPTVYGMIGLMDGLNYTSFPGTENDMGKANRINQKAVRDGRFITARSAGSVYNFVFEIILAFDGEEALKAFKEKIVY